MSYKDTLNLPKTAFPMKADLARREPEILKFWEKIDHYRLVLEKTKDGDRFVLHDGPPYANGDIHLGHTLNKVLKDVIVKYKSMRGYFAPYVPGWDCHGQPIEYEVEKRLGPKKGEMATEEFRRLCRDYAERFVARQKNQFKRLGIRGDWEKPYLTFDPEYEATNVRVFGSLFEKGMISRGKKPIHWCHHCETALAEAEIEYNDEESPSVYVRFPVTRPLPFLKGEPDSVSIVIWTTTPWTLPANVAIAVHPDLSYAAVATGSEILIVAEDLVADLMSLWGFSDFDVLAKVEGRRLAGVDAVSPLSGAPSEVVVADFVDLNQGTGCVHIAPGHGEEDYQLGLKHGLAAPMPVDRKGFLTEQAGRFAGAHISAANDHIVDFLREEKALVASSTVSHSYPHCWRCKKPVIFRATEQWFVRMDEGHLRETALKSIPLVKWVPDWSENRIRGMIDERPDWCISRQRAWGVPLPILYCEKCRSALVTKESIAAIEKLFQKEGADSWFVSAPEEILPAGVSCESCGHKGFVQETDILDVWFESGISHAAVLRTRPELTWPAELYLEGSDQHRGWFQSSLLTAVGADGAPPYRSVLTHGFLVDESKRKMSKSLGNVVDPLSVTEHLGADILRLWTASSDYSTDVAVSDDIIGQISEAYRKIRNTFRFLLGNLNDFDVEKDAVAARDLQEIDRWVLQKLNSLTRKVTDAYDSYRFHIVYREIYAFCIVVLSGFYLDVIKDTLYTFGQSSKARRSAQTAMFQVLSKLTRLAAPVLAFTAEEVWQNMPEKVRDCASVELCDWPVPDETFDDKSLARKWDRFMPVRDEILKALEGARAAKLIGNSLEAAVVAYTDNSVGQLLASFGSSLKALLIVSEAEVKSLESAPPESYEAAELGLRVMVHAAAGAKCQRCWKYSDSVGDDDQYGDVCSKCLEAIKATA